MGSGRPGEGPQTAGSVASSWGARMASFCSGVHVRLVGAAAGSVSSVTSLFWARVVKDVELVKVMGLEFPVSLGGKRLRQVSLVSLTDRPLGLARFCGAGGNHWTTSRKPPFGWMEGASDLCGDRWALELSLQSFDSDVANHQEGVIGDAISRARLESLDVDVVNLEVPADRGQKTLLIGSNHVDDRSITCSLDVYSHGSERSECRRRCRAGGHHAS
jgi:hypothetical protein